MPLTKRTSFFSVEKNETEEVIAHITLPIGDLLITEFAAMVTSENLSNLLQSHFTIYSSLGL